MTPFFKSSPAMQNVLKKLCNHNVHIIRHSLVEQCYMISEWLWVLNYNRNTLCQGRMGP